MDRSRAALRVAENLFATEAAVEDALTRAALLMREMIVARRMIGLPPTAGDAALRRVSAALDALGEAQREIIGSHGELETLRRATGLRVTGFGPLIKPMTGAAEDRPAD